jgi:hypothetical protein
MSRRRRSRNIGFKAFEDTDTDILQWWESMPAGERSAALRQVIRGAIRNGSPDHNGHGHSPEMVQVAADTAWLRSAMMELPTYLEGLLSRMPVAQAAAQTVSSEGQPEQQAKMDQAAVDRRRTNMKRSSW